jgi:hypothetical protein
LIRRHAAIALVLTLCVLAPTAASGAGASAPRCNGAATLCERTLGEVAFATTHNSMASSADHFRPPNQRRTMRAQLEHGIRGFQIDAYFGTPRRGRVYTDLSGPLGQAAELPPHLVTAATLLHRRLGAPPAGTPYDVYLCHVFCELGAVKMVDELRVLRGFLDDHPREVVVMVIEDYVPPDRLLTVFEEAGLASMLLPVDPSAALPTLQQMIDAGTRLLVALENGDGGPVLPNAFSGPVQETPFTFLRPRNLEGGSSCATNRGTADAPIFQFNHWVTPAEPVTANRVNSTILRERIDRCADARGRGPTLVAVDFAEQGELLAVVRGLNR